MEHWRGRRLVVAERLGRSGADRREFLVLVSRRSATYTDCADDLAVAQNGHAALKRHRAVQRQRCYASVAGLVLEVLARAAEDRRRARLVDSDSNARDLRL